MNIVILYLDNVFQGGGQISKAESTLTSDHSSLLLVKPEWETSVRPLQRPMSRGDKLRLRELVLTKLRVERWCRKNKKPSILLVVYGNRVVCTVVSY